MRLCDCCKREVKQAGAFKFTSKIVTFTDGRVGKELKPQVCVDLRVWRNGGPEDDVCECCAADAVVMAMGLPVIEAAVKRAVAAGGGK